MDDSGHGEIRMIRQDGLATVLIRRPWAKNAFTVEMWQQLQAALEALAEDSGVRVVLLRGEGEAFTTGSDVRQFGAMNLEQAEAAFRCMEGAIATLEQVPVPTLAAIDGFALGAGLELALACDVRIASTRARLGMPVARLGIQISADFARRMVDLIGPSRTKDLLFTGRLMPARAALRAGLVNYLVPPADLPGLVEKLTAEIQAQAGSSLRAAKQSVAVALERERVPAAFVHARDFPEGVRAFLERRRPSFSKSSEDLKDEDAP